MKKVLWFSRHQMTTEQVASLGDVEVTAVNGNMENIHKAFTAEVNGVETNVIFKEMMLNFDIIALVAPIGLQQQVMSVANGKPIVLAKNQRILVKGVDGSEDKVTFQFAGWERLVKIEIVVEPFLA